MRRGREYEDLACEYLEGLGYSILSRNYHCGIGEIDIVAQEGDELVFVEVKGSSGEEFGHPAERFTTSKLNRIVSCAFRFMEEKGFDMPFRIDLIVVIKGRITHYKNVGYD
jgi:putative endonuclease